MRAKILNEKYGIEKYMNPLGSWDMSGPYGYYDMANSLDIADSVIPELKANNFNFEYDSYYNFLVIFCDYEEDGELAAQILDDADGQKYTESTLDWHLENREKIESDSAIVVNNLVNR